ncbi:hypothetical protein [Blastochloris tepida]
METPNARRLITTPPDDVVEKAGEADRIEDIGSQRRQVECGD